MRLSLQNHRWWAMDPEIMLLAILDGYAIGICVCDDVCGICQKLFGGGGGKRRLAAQFLVAELIKDR
jgi:hypothetical protein